MAPLIEPSEKDILSSNCLPVNGPQGTPSRTNTDEKVVVQSPTPQWSSRPSKHRLVGFLPTIIVMVITLGFVALLIGFILGTQYVPRQENRGFGAAVFRGYVLLDEEKWTIRKSSEGHLGLLIISSLASHLITDTSSVLMTLIAYRVGAHWLNASQENGDIAQSPTPLQYGLMVRLMGASSISAIGESCIYAARHQTRSRLPRLFRLALTMSVSIWVLARMVGLADLWLHATSKAVSVLKPVPDPSTPYRFSVEFNETICPITQEDYWNIVGKANNPYPCSDAFVDFVSQYDNDMGTTGFYTQANESSSMWSVISLAEAADLAILTPGPAIDISNKSFTASTFGIQANCVSLNSLCAKDSYFRTMTTDCTAAGYPYLPYFNRTSPSEVASNTTEIEDFIFGINVNGELLGKSQGAFDGTNYLTKNPASMAVQLRWDTRNQGASYDLYGAAAADGADRAVDRQPKITLYASCDVSFFNATVRLDGERKAWSLVNRTLSSSEFATTLWLPTLFQRATEHLSSDLLAIARSKEKDDVMAALNQQLARLMLGAASGYFQLGEATDVERLAQTLLGRYSVGPILAFIFLLCLYALLALLVFLSSWWTADQTIVSLYDEPTDVQGASMLALTQMWLTSPIPLVGGAFPGEDQRDGKDGVRSAEKQDGRMVYNGSISDARLGVGLTRDGFGIWKRPVGQKAKEVEEL